MQKFWFYFLFSISLFSIAQDQPKDSISAWDKKGKFGFLFNQSSFQNWTAGGENNISGTASVNYVFNYAKNSWSWTNQIIAAYGLTQINGQDVEKTDDRFEYNSVLGKKAGKYWFYSFFLNFRTQFDKGYRKVTDSLGVERRIERSRIFSPAYYTFGPGMLWKKSNNLYVNISPATSKITTVLARFTETQSAFGVDQGETVNYELGFNSAAYWKFTAMENVTIENIFNMYIDYLENTDEVDLSYQLNVLMKINSYLSTNFNFHAIYDTDAIARTQVKQVFGLSVNYDF